MGFLLAVEKSDYADKIIDTKGFLETIGFGGRMFLLGMLTVFAILGIIWLCLTAMKYVFDKNGGAKKSENSKVVIEAAPAPVAENAYDDAEIVAVIAAAIAMAEEENQGAKFRVVSFRKNK